MNKETEINSIEDLVELIPTIKISENELKQPYGSCETLKDIFSNYLRDDIDKNATIPSYFSKQIVVDLGSQRNNGKYIAVKLGAKAYIGVNIIPFGRNEYHLDYRNPTDKRDIITFAINEDMRTFIQRLPDNSCSFIISGIDNCIITDKRDRDFIAKESARALHPQGAIIQDEDSEIFYESNFINLKNESLNPEYKNYKSSTVFQKKTNNLY